MQKPLAAIFTCPAEEPELIGSRCRSCAAVTFPTQSRCPRCSTTTMEDLPLPRRGTLVAWTTQGFLPFPGYGGGMAMEEFEPFGVGLVQLDDVVRVESRLTENDPAKLEFGMEVELEIVPLYTDEEGDEVMTFAFAPVAGTD